MTDSDRNSELHTQKNQKAPVLARKVVARNVRGAPAALPQPPGLHPPSLLGAGWSLAGIWGARCSVRRASGNREQQQLRASPGAYLVSRREVFLEAIEQKVSLGLDDDKFVMEWFSTKIARDVHGNTTLDTGEK